ncbi:hypothetical protein PVK06_043444 [Gossypium arboreum]|uniref:Uncharacterized protein n=1 Tax=Gossypium arboreum TaxID=29729 RepID=A0ABR0MNL2_GOSAR|nr:hypothetical protein PVK06_043444 [Gossypium arboreum]
MLIPRALSSEKALYENNGWLLPSTAVLGIIPNVIFGTSEPPTVCVATCEQIGNYTGNQMIVHRTLSMEAICRGRDRSAHTIIGYRAAIVVRVKCFVDSFLYGRVARWRLGIEPNDRHLRRPSLYVLEGGFSPTREYAEWYMPRSRAQYEAYGSSSYHPELELKLQFPPSFEDILCDDPELQHLTQSGSSSYHWELDPEAHTPTTEDIFPLTPLITQYPLTPDYGVYDYTTFLSTPDGTPKAGPSNYQTPQQGA